MEFMQLALDQAQKAFDLDEVPVGAVIAKDGRVLASAHNLKETSKLATHHAEILVIEEACRALQSWRLSGCELYVTLEPCLMCAGAVFQSRIDKVIFGTRDPKGGVMGSLMSVHQETRFNHRFEVEEGERGEECSRILTDFFRKKRASK